MHFHLPKPMHGWREFVGEVGIIVLGVLIALGAEQAIEWLHWRQEADLARGALAFDFRRIIGQAAQTDAYSPCLAERLGQYNDILDQAQATKQLPPVGFGGTPFFPPWNLRSWSGLTSGKALAHMSNRDQLAVSGLTVALDWERDLREQQSNDWGVLTTMLGPGRPVSDVEIANLRATLARVARNASTQRGLGLQLETEIVQSGFLTRAQAQAAYQEGLAFGRASPMCRPPAPPPPDSRSVLTRELTGPPTPLGQKKLKGVGVGGAITTDR